MAKIKKLIRSIFPFDYYKTLNSYSQEGEDMVLRSFFEGVKNYKGFYVDVGAHHPVRFSNTYHFYKKGWKGINIEPTPSAIRSFNLLRRRDINLNFGVGSQPALLTFYSFNEPALNGFSKDLSYERDKSDNYHIISEQPIQVYPLKDILEKYLPAGQNIDFLTIDVEGLDLDVLHSNDWEKYRPSFILVEDKVNLDDLGASKIYNFLREKDYQMVAKTLRTLFFARN